MDSSFSMDKARIHCQTREKGVLQDCNEFVQTRSKHSRDSKRDKISLLHYDSKVDHELGYKQQRPFQWQ